MRMIKKLTLVLTIALAISTLSACGEDGKPLAGSGTSQSTSTESSKVQSSKAQSSKKQSKPVSSSAPEESVPTITSTPETSIPEGFPENPSEDSLKYYEDATNLVDKYLCTVMSNPEEIERLGLYDLDDENPEDLKKMVRYLIDCANNAEGYLDELAALVPTDEMRAFHGELVGLMNTLRGYTSIAKGLENVEIMNDDATDKYNERTYLLFERFNKEYERFYIKYPAFGKKLAEGEWAKNSSLVMYYFYAPDLGADAEQCAKSVSLAITYGFSVQEDKPPLENNAVIEIIHTKNGCEITGAAIGDDGIRGIKYYLDITFPKEYEFWARVYLREDGSPRCTLYSPDGRLDDSELNGGKGLAENLREWRDTCVTSGGHIIGVFGAPPTDEATTDEPTSDASSGLMNGDDRR